MNSAKRPRLPISAIIPTFNREDLCLRALLSVYSQSALPAQVIVVDDGSSEELTMVKQLLEENAGIYLRQNNLGVSAARNFGVSHANQEWIAFLDSDDLWLDTKLEKQFQLHLEDPTLMISQTAEKWFQSGKEVKQKRHQIPAEGECFARCLELCCISASAVILNKSVFIAEGGFDTDFVVCEDYDLWLRLSRKYSVGLVSQPLVEKYRDLDSQLSSSVEAIDRYRLNALVKLLSISITPEQRELVVKKIVEKIVILEKGAKKRGLQADLMQYQNIKHSLKIEFI